MTRSSKSLVMGCYAAAVVANGLLSVLAKEAGKAGLWFGLVMGASGSGKTTLLHLLAGLATPDGGRVDDPYSPRLDTNSCGQSA